MITFNINTFADSTSPNLKLVAIDLGTKQIGIAISDAKQAIVEDYFQFRSNGMENDVTFLSEKYSSKEYAGIIIGLPFSHTRENRWTNYIDSFAYKLNKTSSLPICMVDESYSTQGVNYLIQSFSRKRQKKWKDKLSACCILEQTLCTINHYRWHSKNV